MKLDSCSKPFATIAPYYDRLMSFVNYRNWVDYIERIMRMSGIKEKVVFDVACGTGVCLELWMEKGYRVIGLDRSLEMLAVCRQRLAGEDGALFFAGDMRDFSLGVRVPVITCLYDSLNYLLKEEELLAFFRSAAAALRPEGVLIFDMNTIHSLRDEWGNNSFRRRDEGLLSVWTNTYDPGRNVSSLKIGLHVNDNGSEKVFEEFHQERGYFLAEIEDMLREAGLTCSLYRHLTFTPATELDLRIMGVARK